MKGTTKKTIDDNVNKEDLLKKVSKELELLNENKDKYNELYNYTLKAFRINKKEKQLLDMLNKIDSAKDELLSMTWEEDKTDRVKVVSNIYSLLQMSANTADGLLSLERNFNKEDRDNVKKFIHPY